MLRSRMKGTRAQFTARKADSQPSEVCERRFDRMGLNHEGKTAIICCDRSHKAGSPGTYVRIPLSKSLEPSELFFDSHDKSPTEREQKMGTGDDRPSGRSLTSNRPAGLTATPGNPLSLHRIPGQTLTRPGEISVIQRLRL